MTERDVGKELAEVPTLLPSPRMLGRRVVRMTLIWLLFGAFLGASLAPARGMISIISGTIAGMMVMPWLGTFLGLIGGQVKEALIGALFGAFVGAGCGLVSGEPVLLYKIDMGLIIGGIVGANFSAFSAWFWKGRQALEAAAR